jgi:hypothetical protein
MALVGHDCPDLWAIYLRLGESAIQLYRRGLAPHRCEDRASTSPLTCSEV